MASLPRVLRSTFQSDLFASTNSTTAALRAATVIASGSTVVVQQQQQRFQPSSQQRRLLHHQRQHRIRPTMTTANPHLAHPGPRQATARTASTLSPARAIVAHAPGEGHVPGANWQLQDISVPTELKAGEVLVQMVATGICHTDLLMTSGPPEAGMTYPWVAGHEGSGIVRAVGPGVIKDIAAGDPVLLSFDNCSNCHSCHTHHPAYCDSFFPLNLAGVPEVFKDAAGAESVTGQFFGQSSFASLSVVKEASILPAKHLIQSDEELKLFSPLGCGIQTGTGSILNVVKPLPDDRIMVLGLGGVGLGAVMGAVIAGCKQIIAVDRVQSRIDLAKSFGATHGVNTSGVKDFTAAFQEITSGLGPSVCIETTAFTPLLEAGFQSLGQGGSFVFIGASPNPEAALHVNIQQLMLKGARVIGCIEGDAIPEKFLPQLIQYYRAGQLPIDKIVKFYKAEDFKTALHDMHTGETIKPVLVW